MISSAACPDVVEVVEAFETDSFEVISLAISLEVELDFGNRTDLSDVILLFLETVFEEFFWIFDFSDIGSFFLESTPELVTRSMSLIGSEELLWLSDLDKNCSSTPEAIGGFESIAEGDDRFEGIAFDEFVDEFAADTIVNDVDEDIGTSSLELLLEDTHEYDFKPE